MTPSWLDNIVDFFKSKKHIEEKRRAEAEAVRAEERKAYAARLLRSPEFEPVMEIIDEEIERCIDIMTKPTIDRRYMELQKGMAWYLSGLRYLQTLQSEETINQTETETI